MPSEITPLASQLSKSLSANSGPTPWLFAPLLKLLAHGHPVTMEQLATAVGRSTEEVRDALTTMSDTEYDEQGRILGSGLTLRPTPHQFEVDGISLYTWCALDTLIFPAILGQTAHVTSPCHNTRQLVHLTVGSDGVTNVEPETAVVSLVTPDAPASVRAAFCNQVHFFVDREAARPWLSEHPSGSILPVAEAYQLSRPLTQTLIDGDTPPDCC